ncbi:CLUMA_CG001940, isoform A [Clunio marinus]|uniref:Guanine nucleotide-binding protein-like 3 homolog n=1 Tax=Clunio marinus TaxID=568069 RepID=A0A1J1HJR4_9DIPT|nr:CLUMA_CG001940, isoform A [Clunio marinus]
MALKGLKNRKSRRVPAARRYKIIKKIADSKRKKEKEAKKLPKRSAKQKLIQIPNICPFKEEILKDVEADKARREEEKKEKLEKMKLERLEAKKKQTLESIVSDAAERGDNHVEKDGNDDVRKKIENQNNQKTKENSLKSYFKEFKKVVDAADVILEVCDARDPLGTRCSEVSTIIRESPGQKKHVLVLNKSDLIPRENLDRWLKYLRKFGPVIPFKASTQTQKQNIGRRKFNNRNKGQKIQSSPCIGANLLMSLLANYSRNKDMKTSIRVGIVGIPNVGKSSIINSLKRRRACQVGANPGITRTMQEVEIDSNIKIIDSPGIIFQRPKNESPDEFFALKNAQHINTVQDPFPLATDILKRATVMYFCKLYDITEYRTPEEFLAKKAVKMGKLIRGGVPDIRSAARSLIHDWNTGKIKYCTQPPMDNSLDIHLGASIVTNPQEQKELQIDDLDELEKTFMNQLDEHYNIETDEVVMEVETKGPVLMKTSKKNKNDYGDGDIFEDEEEVIKADKKKKRKSEDDGYETKKLKEDPVFKIAGNQSLNKLNKSSAKKLKKQKTKTDKKISNVADVLDNFSLDMGDDGDYDFDDDYVVE